MTSKNADWLKKQSTGDPLLDLFAAVAKLAIRDAGRGNKHAAQWLDMVIPHWRRYGT